MLLRLVALLALLGAALGSFALPGWGGAAGTERLGLLCCAFTVSMYGAPLRDMVSGYGVVGRGVVETVGSCGATPLWGSGLPVTPLWGDAVMG